MNVRTMQDQYFLTDPLAPINGTVPHVKIAGIKICRSYDHFNGTELPTVIPTNRYGHTDNRFADNTNVIHALMRKLQKAKQANAPMVSVWGAL